MIKDAITQIIAQLNVIDGIGHVHNHMPLTGTGTLLKDRFVAEGVLNGWTVTRVDAQRDPDDGTLTTYRHTILIEGRLTYQDAASQARMDGCIDRILAVFRQDDTLGGTVDDVVSVRLREHRPYLFFNLLCHYAKIEVVVHTHH